MIKGVDLHVKAGEVVGIAGLMGSGRTELAMSVFGRAYGRNVSGRAFMQGREIVGGFDAGIEVIALQSRWPTLSAALVQQVGAPVLHRRQLRHLLQHGGFGATAAAPIARKAMDAYLVKPDAPPAGNPAAVVAAPSPTADAANVTSARDAQPATEAHRP